MFCDHILFGLMHALFFLITYIRYGRYPREIAIILFDSL